MYDDWERLVRATIRREELWQLCHEHSRTPSGGSTTSGSSSPVVDVSPKGLRSRVSPLNQQNSLGGEGANREVVLRSSSARVSPVNQQVAPESSSAPPPLSRQEGGNGLKKEKSMRRSKSRMRLDRWVWTRWLSNSF